MTGGAEGLPSLFLKLLSLPLTFSKGTSLICNVRFPGNSKTILPSITWRNKWRFCRSCHHAETTAVLEEQADACPACGDGGWGDVGLRKHLLVMGQVYAIARHRDAVLGDDAEDRERKYYERVSLFEAESQARDAWSNDTVGFGFELQPRLVLRDLNLGPRDDRSNPQTTVLAGQLVQEVGFRVGLAVVLSLMILATWNDVVRNFF